MPNQSFAQHHAYHASEADVAQITNAPPEQHAALAQRLVEQRIPDTKARKTALVTLMPKRPAAAQIERLALLAVLHDINLPADQ